MGKAIIAAAKGWQKAGRTEADFVQAWSVIARPSLSRAAWRKALN